MVHSGAVNIYAFTTCKCNNSNDTLTISPSALCTVCKLKVFQNYVHDYVKADSLRET